MPPSLNRDPGGPRITLAEEEDCPPRSRPLPTSAIEKRRAVADTQKRVSALLFISTSAKNLTRNTPPLGPRDCRYHAAKNLERALRDDDDIHVQRHAKQSAAMNFNKPPVPRAPGIYRYTATAMGAGMWFWVSVPGLYSLLPPPPGNARTAS